MGGLDHLQRAACDLPATNFRIRSKADIGRNNHLRNLVLFALDCSAALFRPIIEANESGKVPNKVCPRPYFAIQFLARGDSCMKDKRSGKERRSGPGRRSGLERRSGLDTRSEEEKLLQGERRVQPDRRSVLDRRARLPRRRDD
jgi:hypothetical protein